MHVADCFLWWGTADQNGPVGLRVARSIPKSFSRLVREEISFPLFILWNYLGTIERYASYVGHMNTVKLLPNVQILRSGNTLSLSHTRLLTCILRFYFHISVQHLSLFNTCFQQAAVVQVVKHASRYDVLFTLCKVYYKSLLPVHTSILLNIYYLLLA
jgi:hypothetical protein